MRRTRGFGELDLGIGDYAHLGVLVFFVISGFLITTLLREQAELRLRDFYYRRALRIFPPAYAYMAIVFALSHFDATTILHAVTYTTNFQPAPSARVVHLWSLSVEEQFYLLWPLAVARLRKPASVALAVLVLAPAARIVSWLFLVGTPYYGLPMFPMVADSLAAGCLLAEWREPLEQNRLYLRLFRPLPSLALLALTLITHRFLNRTAGVVFGTSVMNIAIAVLVHRCVFRASRFLNWKPLIAIGAISYSLYLWQELFIDRTQSGWMNTFPQSVICAVAAGTASYWILERPLQRWRRSIGSARKEEGTAESN